MGQDSSRMGISCHHSTKLVFARKVMTYESVQWDELCNLVMNYPVFPGDTISHRTMNHLGELGFAVRQQDGNWIPTKIGLDRWKDGPQPGDKGTSSYDA